MIQEKKKQRHRHLLKRRKPDLKAFTLIELSIVLVIIALIVASIMVGKDLIQSAQIRKAIKQKEQLETAANTFRTKYNCVAGDCANASQFGFLSWHDSAPINGNGNNAIQYTFEIGNFFTHLESAGLLGMPILVSPAQGNFINEGSLNGWYAGVSSPKAEIVSPPATLSVSTTSGTIAISPGGWEVVTLGVETYNPNGIVPYETQDYMASMTGTIL